MGCKSFKLCTGDLDRVVDFQKRTQGALAVGSTTPTTTFTNIATGVFAKMQTVEGTRRFAGVAIDERATHLISIRYDPALAKLEDGNHFVLYDSRRFRVLRVTNVDELNQFLVIQASDRGDDDKGASGS